MSIILFCKAHIPAYTKKDGTHVPAHETNAPGAKIKAKPAAPAAARCESWAGRQVERGLQGRLE